MNKKWMRLKALFIKEKSQIYRDPSSLIISVILPLFLLFLYGTGVSLDLNHLRLGVVLEEDSEEAYSFLQSITNSRYFDVTVRRNREEIQDKIMDGSLRGFVVIPSYFSQYLKREDKRAPIQVIADGSETNTANFTQLYVFGAFQKFLSQEGIQPIIETKERYWYNEQLESHYFLLSGSLALIMTLIGTLLTALVISREWERGTMESMMSTPVTVVELVVGKLIPYFILGMVSMGICVAASVWIYGLPLRGSIFLLFGVSALFLMGAIGMGLFISTIAKNQVLAYQISVIVGFLPAYILSGYLFEISSMPKWIQFITFFIPARYFVQALQTLFLVGNVWQLILYDSLVLFFMALFFLTITALKTVKRLE
jgi:ABC-2 type transport system permease protein